MSNPRDLFAELPEELITKALAEYIPLKTMAVLPRVSRYWYAQFSKEDAWRTNLIGQLGVKKEVLDQLEVLRNTGKIKFSNQDLHHRYYNFLKRKAELEELKVFIPNNKAYQEFILSSCLDNNYVLQWLPKEMRKEIHMWSLCADASVVDENHMRTLSSGQIKGLALTLAIGLKSFKFFGRIETLKDAENKPLFIMPKDFYVYGPDEKNKNKMLVGKIAPQSKITICSTKDLNSAMEFIDLEIFCDALARGIIPDDITLLSSIRKKKADIFQEIMSGDVYGNLQSQKDLYLIIPENILCAVVEAEDIELFRLALTIKDKDGNLILVPSQDILDSLPNDVSSAMVHELLTLKDEHGGQLLRPTMAMLGEAIKEPDHIDRILDLLACRDENGDPILVPDEANIALAKEKCVSIAPLLLTSYRAMCLALHEFIYEHNWEKTARYLKDAYQASSFMFFLEIDNMLKHPKRSFDNNAQQCLQRFVNDLLQSESNDAEASVWAVGKLTALEPRLAVMEQVVKVTVSPKSFK
jgi:hypothetical protein